MKRTNISSTKNNLSKLIDEVRKGETTLIVDRDVPVARLVPVGSLESFSDRLSGLARDGLVSLPEEVPGVDSVAAELRVSLPPGASGVQALLQDREESR